MNRQMKIGLAIISAILLIVCMKVIITELPKEIKNKEQISYNSMSIKTSLYIEGMESPRIDVIEDLQGLYDYLYTFANDELELQFKKYYNSYFDDKVILVLTIQEGSSSIDNNISDVIKTNSKTINIKVNRKVPQVGTADMAMSHLIIEVDKKHMENIQKILVNGKEVTIYNK